MVRWHLATAIRTEKSPQLPGKQLRAGNETRDGDKGVSEACMPLGEVSDRGPFGENLTGKFWRGAAACQDGQQANARLGGAICSFVFHDRKSDMGEIGFKFFADRFENGRTLNSIRTQSIGAGRFFCVC